MSPARSIFGGRQAGGSLKSRLAIAAVLALVALMTYYSQQQENPITGDRQHVNLTHDQEIALGLQAMPSMVQQHGGPSADPRARQRVDRIGNELLTALNRWIASQGKQNPWEFRFHLLRDPQTVNAFALPGGQVFITEALYSRLTTDGQLAGVLGHEIGHVLERHGAERISTEQLMQGLVGAAGVAGGDVNSAQMAQMVGRLISMQYGQKDELESDKWGVRIMAMAGYDPRALLEVMKVLDEASGGKSPPEFLSTHPKPANRMKYIQEVIATEFPQGLPPGLER